MAAQGKTAEHSVPDPRLVELVKYLARRAAELDYADQRAKLDIPSPQSHE